MQVFDTEFLAYKVTRGWKAAKHTGTNHWDGLLSAGLQRSTGFKGMTAKSLEDLMVHVYATKDYCVMAIAHAKDKRRRYVKV